jgi:hypothetical protein
MRLRYGIALVALFFCTTPLERSPTPEDAGMAFSYAMFALLIAIVAIVAALRTGKAVPAVQP